MTDIDELYLPPFGPSDGEAREMERRRFEREASKTHQFSDLLKRVLSAIDGEMNRLQTQRVKALYRCEAIRSKQTGLRLQLGRERNAKKCNSLLVEALEERCLVVAKELEAALDVYSSLNDRQNLLLGALDDLAVLDDFLRYHKVTTHER